MEYSVLSETSIPYIPGKSKPYVIAHRGNQVKCPENTLAAFRQAIADGADIIETDLHITADNVFICIHDDTLDRTTNGSGEVEKMTLAEVQAFSASNGRPGFDAERIPALAELIDMLPEDVALALELKTDRFLEPQVCRLLLNQLRAAQILNRTIALSFSLDRLRVIQNESREIHTGWITLSKLTPFRGPHMMGPFWPLLMLNPFYVKIAHRRNQAVCPLDPLPDSRLWFYRLLGCDAVLTDDPGTTCAAMRKYRSR
jgi:glycerophosphoryl diester phosphodiesterase